MQRLFECSGSHPIEARRSWAEVASKEFFDGDPQPNWDSGLQFTFDKALAYPISLTRFHGQMDLSYRRSWHHIRSNRVGVRILWFVRNGSAKITRSVGDCTINAGEVGIVDSNQPYHVRMYCEEGGVHESFLATVPLHLFYDTLANADSLSGAVDMNTPEGALVQRLMDFIYKEGDALSPETAKPLAECFLKAVSEAIGCAGIEKSQPQRLIDKRLADIKNYILMNLSDTELSYDKVATSCGISPRYLCYLLKMNEMSFSNLLWTNRIACARDWLIAKATLELPINMIAFMAGFKSAAHFSRMFKSTFGCPPSEYRTLYGSGDQDVGHHDAQLDGQLLPMFAHGETMTTLQ